jgi:hypothetical protein
MSTGHARPIAFNVTESSENGCDQVTRAERISIAEVGGPFKISETENGIFDSFETKDAREAHLNGEIPTALGQVAGELLAKDPQIRTVDIVAVK